MQVFERRLMCAAGGPGRYTRLGCSDCRYSASVQLATKVIDTEAKLRATLLHELCHVATWVLPPHVAKVSSLLWTPSRGASMHISLAKPQLQGHNAVPCTQLPAKWLSSEEVVSDVVQAVCCWMHLGDLWLSWHAG